MKSHHAIFSNSWRRRFRATCSNGHQPVHEKKQLVQRNPDRCKEFDKESLKVLQGSRKTRDPLDLGLTGSGQKGARGYAEVLKCIALSSIRNAAHGVDDVFVESGEEAAGGRLRQN